MKNPIDKLSLQNQLGKVPNNQLGVKPIVVIYIPKTFDLGNGISSPNIELMNILNGFGDKYKPTDYWKDYLWFCWIDYKIQTPRFEVFYPKDFNEMKYEELKQLVEKELKQLTA